MSWTPGQNERREITETISDKEARRLPKMRKITVKMGGLREERSQKGRGGWKVERKGQQQGPMETNYKNSRKVTIIPASPLQKGNQGKNKMYTMND